MLHLLVLAFLILSVADAALTIGVLKNGGTERNKLLGKHPKPATVALYALGTSAAVAAVAYFVIPDVGPAMLFVSVLLIARSYAVIHNIRSREDQKKLGVK